MRIVLTIVVACLASASVLAQRQSQPPNPFTSVQGFQCTFTNYAVATVWDETTAQVVSGTDTFEYRVAGLDLRRNAGRVVVSETASIPVTAILTETGLNVIEQTQIGNFILTTIFLARGSADRYVAVHSRHLGDPATLPSVSQYYGRCEAAP